MASFPSFPSWAKLSLRLLVAGALLAWLASSLDLDRLGSLVVNLRIGWLLAAAALILVGRLVEASRWHILLLDRGLEVPVPRLVQAVFISMFLGQFLPGVVGPDLVRGYWVARRRGQTGSVATSLLSARIVGLYAMLVVALAGAFLARQFGRATDLVYVLVALNLVGFAGWVLATRWLSYVEERGWFKDGTTASLWRRALQGAHAVARVAEHFPALAWVVLLSLTLVLLRCLIFFGLYRAFRAPVPYDLLMVFIPALFIITLLPISIGGLGVREVSLAALLGTVGVAAEVSVGVGLAFHALQIVTSLPGAPMWLMARRRSSVRGRGKDDMSMAGL